MRRRYRARPERTVPHLRRRALELPLLSAICWVEFKAHFPPASQPSPDDDDAAFLSIRVHRKVVSVADCSSDPRMIGEGVSADEFDCGLASRNAKSGEDDIEATGS